ncbi:thioredoxin family protein [Nonlabens ulvanivorans]|uniref:thioredoxin family protein n=1 Tax=Nonlabens ulvanivorans TaxID=906888 RepID=UPI0037C9C266
MKKIILLLTVILLASCGTQKATTEKEASVAQPEVPATPEPPKTPVLVNGHLSGVQTKDAFMQEPFSTWFTPRYNAYSLDEETKSTLADAMKDVEIRAYMGTWCGDSKRETPMFYKLLDEVGFKEKNLTLITVDRSKSKPEELVSGYNVVRVPTFIFYRGGQEIGRYVERPRESLEKDILKIVTGVPYKHSYDN